MTAPSNTVTITVNNQVLWGFKSVSVTRGIDTQPYGSFSITMTEKFPDQPKLVVKPNDKIVIKFGSDTILTGFVLTYGPDITGNSHDVVITGVSKFWILTTASAVQKKPSGWPQNGNDQSITLGAGIYNQTVKAITQTLCAPYHITVSGDASGNVPIVQFSLGETPYQIIEPISRWAQVIVYDDVNGNLVLGAVGKNKHSSGFSMPGNIKTASVTFDTTNRFSDYYVTWNSVDTFRDSAPGTNLHGYAQDQGMAQAGIFKPIFLVSTQTMNGVDIGQQRAVWERNRRYGRSQAIRITAYDWRDSNGLLWQPNYLAAVDAPEEQINKVQWIIAQVTFTLGDAGTSATLLLMPPEAFSVEPAVLSVMDWDLVAGLNNNQTTNNPQPPPAVRLGPLQ